MQIKSLGCDWCKDPRDAIASVRLTVEQSDGRRRRQGPTADVCEAHLRALGIIFAPRKRTRIGTLHKAVEVEKLIAAVERGRALDNARHQTEAAKERAKEELRRKAQGKRAKVVRTYTEASFAAARAKHAQVQQDREGAILATLRHADHRMSRPELDDICGLTMSQTTKVLHGLVKRGEVTRYSNGPHARYELASKARHGSDEHAA